MEDMPQKSEAPEDPEGAAPVAPETSEDPETPVDLAGEVPATPGDQAQSEETPHKLEPLAGPEGESVVAQQETPTDPSGLTELD